MFPEKRASDPLYESPRGHCIGANFFLSENMRCSGHFLKIFLRKNKASFQFIFEMIGSGVIMCPMFPFHEKEGREFAKRFSSDAKFAQTKLSKNMVTSLY